MFLGKIPNITTHNFHKHISELHLFEKSKGNIKAKFLLVGNLLAKVQRISEAKLSGIRLEKLVIKVGTTQQIYV